MQAKTREEYAASWAATLSLPAGSQVMVIQLQNDWSYVAAPDGARGFVPTTLLVGLDGQPLSATAPVSARADSASVASCHALVDTDYQAETPESLSLPRGARVAVLNPGEDWTFVDHAGKRGFVPTPLLRVNGVEPLLEYCTRNHIAVASAANTESASETSHSRDLTTDLVVVRKAIASNAVSGSVEVAKDPRAVIPSSLWSTLSETERHRQQLLYGIIHSEFVYNKTLWALNHVAKEFQGAQQTLSYDERDALFRDADKLYALSNAMLALMIKRWEMSSQGLVVTLTDIVHENLHAFDAYVAFCSKERRALQQRIFLEYKGQFGHPFHAFLEQLATTRMTDLEALVAAPLKYLQLWPVLLKNLLKDTSKSREPEQFKAIQKLQRYMVDLVAQLSRASSQVATELKHRFVNYVKVEPHLRGNRLLKESPAKIVSGSGVDYGDHAFLFDSCLVLARKSKSGAASATDEPTYRALKKLKLVGMRIVDVHKANLVLRSGGERYNVALPNATVCVDWRNLISFKTYRGEMLETSEYDGDDEPARVRLPTKEPAFDAHVTRVKQMQAYISGLLNEEPPPIPELAAGRETLQLRSGASARPEEGSLRVAHTAAREAVGGKVPPKQPSLAAGVGHEYTDSDDDDDADAPKGKSAQSLPPVRAQRSASEILQDAIVTPRKGAPGPPATGDPRSTTQILGDAMVSPPRTGPQARQQQPDYGTSGDEEEEDWEELSSDSGRLTSKDSTSAPVKTLPKPPDTESGKSAIAQPPGGDSSEFESEWETEYESESREVAPSSKPGVAVAVPPPTVAATPSPASLSARNTAPVTPSSATATAAAAGTAARKAGDDGSDDLSLDSSSTGRNRGSKAAATPVATMYRTLTGQLDALVTQGNSEEWEVEEESYTDDSDAAPTAAAAAVAAQRRVPTAIPVTLSDTPDATPARVASPAGTISRASVVHADDDDEEWEYEDEDEWTEE